MPYPGPPPSPNPPPIPATSKITSNAKMAWRPIDAASMNAIRPGRGPVVGASIFGGVIGTGRSRSRSFVTSVHGSCQGELRTHVDDSDALLVQFATGVTRAAERGV